jgi:2,3-bisphosphoglycerate-dependent phosphoglycerate mutase
MNKPILIFLLFFVSLSYSQVVNDLNCTSIYLIRHAEKERKNINDKNPHLNSKGLIRAEKWNSFFKNIKFDAVYSTDYFRTKETAKPILSESQKLTIYNPSSINYDDFMELNKGKIVLVVGHSNTIPNFSNKILEKDIYKNIEDNNNSNLYFISKCDGNITSHALYYVN